MNTIDRSKFKKLGAPIAEAQAADKQLENQLGYKKGGRSDFHQIEEGMNTFRIYPPHPEENGGGIQYAQPKVTTFLPRIVEETDKEGNVIMEGGRPKTKQVQKSVFNSRIHGGMRKDLIDEYIAIARKEADVRFPNAAKNEQEKLAKQNFLDHIYGRYHDNPAYRKSGVAYKTTWVMYADKISGSGTKEFGRLEVSKSVRDRLNAIAAIESKGDPLGTDPFTDIDEGRAITILYNKAAQAAQKYSTEIDSSTEMETVNGRQMKVLKSWALTDAEIEHWLKQKPLLELLGPSSFKKSDLELQIEGLELYDRQNKLGIYDLPEFQAVIEEVIGYFESSDVEDIQDVEEVNDEPTSDSTDPYDIMSRDELKAEIKSRKLGIVVRPNVTDDALRSMLREDDEANEDANAAEEKPQEEPSSSNDDFLDEMNATNPPAQSAPRSASSRLSALKDRVKNK